MRPFSVPRKRLLMVSLGFVLALMTWQVAVVFAQAPLPNPLALVPPGNPIFAPVPGVNILANGPAASIHGDPGKGRVLFAENCTTCHNDRGIGGLANPGSDDGTVPSLNPIDPGFLEQSGRDPASFANGVDLFVQHGSRPSGDNPQVSMIGWGDHKLLSQQDIADVEAYVMQLNGVYWPDRWAPPAQVWVDASRSGNVVTYSITLINHGSSSLGELKLQDTLPTGLTYVGSGVPSLGQNPGQLSGHTVTWLNLDGVPQGGTLGPFVIQAQVTGATVPANVAELFFSWQSADGTTFKSSTVSLPAIPGQPSSEPRPLALSTMVPMAAAAPSASATPAPSATREAGPAVKIVQPEVGALSWGYSPASITIRVGDTVTWTNTGSLAHTVTADDGSFDTGLINPGESRTLTFNKAGTFTYHCSPHPWMKGTVIVQAS